MDVTSAMISTMATAAVALDASEAMGPAGAELARSLPELVEQLKLLREEMEKCSKVYDSIASGQTAVTKPARIPSSSSLLGASSSAPNSGASSRGSVSFYGQPVEYRESIYTPFARASDVDFPGSNSYTRDSSIGSNGNGSNSISGAAMRDSYGRISEDPSDVADVPPPAPGATNYSRMTKQQHRASQRLPRPNVRVPPVVRDVDYSVIWVSGECGISLRNFSANKIGAQIAVLQQADGVTTGISNCRLGDQLMTVNEDPVLDVRFKEIVEKLKTMRRPIKLGFRTNQNVATSPTASSAPSSSRSRVSRAHPSLSNHRFSQSSQRQSGVFFPEDEDAQGDRGTMTSVRSSLASNLSDEVEGWCREQEEMHSDIIVLLTETVLRCEKLQQENMDQLQNWMHVEPSMYADTSDVTKPTAAVATPEES